MSDDERLAALERRLDRVERQLLILGPLASSPLPPPATQAIVNGNVDMLLNLANRMTMVLEKLYTEPAAAPKPVDGVADGQLLDRLSRIEAVLDQIGRRTFKDWPAF